MNLYNITYKLRKGTNVSHKYVWANTAVIAGNKHKRKYGKSHVILKVRLA